MSHVFKTFDTLLHGKPSALQVMCAPEIPLRVRNRFPINFSVISDIQGVNPAGEIRLVQIVQRKEKRRTYEQEYNHPAGSIEAFHPHF